MRSAPAPRFLETRGKSIAFMKSMGKTLIAVLAGLVLGGCQAAPQHRTVTANDHGGPAAHADTDAAMKTASFDPAGCSTVDLHTMPQLTAIIPTLAKKRVVFVGETHDQYAHHLMQLEIIKRLHALHPDLAIGMEYFQQPFQKYLDDYIAGRIDEKEMLRRTEYFKRWRYDYRLYRPILTYAREQRIPLVALNIRAELSRKVAQGGLKSLTPDERKSVPTEFDESDKAYRQRLKEIYDHHPDPQGHKFDYFVQAQLLWDEGMAQRAAEYLAAHPGRPMVILAGSGHIMYGSGIPNRLERRTGIPLATVINGVQDSITPNLANFLLLPPEVKLPPAGRMGVLLDEGAGAVHVRGFEAGSPAEKAGLENGDAVLSLAGDPVASMADVRIAMLDKKPGDTIQVKVRRNGLFVGAKVETYSVKLH
jgi:uncharacterized iron-regulated protein